MQITTYRITTGAS